MSSSPSAIYAMTVIRYYRGGKKPDSETVVSPAWAEVEAAIRRMDDYCFPLVQLNTTDNEQSSDIFNVCGGKGRWALFHMMGAWQYEDPKGRWGEVRLWQSDQGYYCYQKNVLKDIEKVLRITQAYYQTGSYEGLNAVV